jgi:hypothetical protein
MRARVKEGLYKGTKPPSTSAASRTDWCVFRRSARVVGFNPWPRASGVIVSSFSKELLKKLSSEKVHSKAVG